MRQLAAAGKAFGFAGGQAKPAVDLGRNEQLDNHPLRVPRGVATAREEMLNPSNQVESVESVESVERQMSLSRSR